MLNSVTARTTRGMRMNSPSLQGMPLRCSMLWIRCISFLDDDVSLYWFRGGALVTCMTGPVLQCWLILWQVWPRTAAVAERLWSDYSSTQSQNSAFTRLSYQRCRLVVRGIASSPTGPGFCPSGAI